MAFVGRFFDPPAQSYYLFGPRGTGKSAWTQHHYRDSVRIDLLHPATLQRYRAGPERLFDLVRAQPHGQVIVIDEVQRVPDLLSAVHALIEEQRGWRFVLTGSSARKLRRSGVDLMAGRAVVRTMHPFMAAELEASFDLPAALQRGMLPLVLGAEDPVDTLQSYVAVYVREEVQMEGLVRDLDGFFRFLEAVSFSHAQLLNVSNIARDSEVSRKTTEGYLGVLEDLLLSFRVPVFRKRAARATVAHNKLYLFDCGVFRSLRPSGPLDRREEIAGSGAGRAGGPAPPGVARLPRRRRSPVLLADAGRIGGGLRHLWTGAIHRYRGKAQRHRARLRPARIALVPRRLPGGAAPAALSG